MGISIPSTPSNNWVTSASHMPVCASVSLKVIAHNSITQFYDPCNSPHRVKKKESQLEGKHWGTQREKPKKCIWESVETGLWGNSRKGFDLSRAFLSLLAGHSTYYGGQPLTQFGISLEMLNIFPFFLPISFLFFLSIFRSWVSASSLSFEDRSKRRGG